MTDKQPTHAERNSGAVGDAFARYREAASERRPPARPVAPAVAALVCAGALVVGALGPWLHRRRGTGRPTETLDGVAIDGPLVLIGAAVAVLALLVVLAKPGVSAAGWASVAGMAFATVVGAANVLVLDTAGPGYVGQTRGALHEIGWGLWLVVAAGVLGTACAVVVLRRLD